MLVHYYLELVNMSLNMLFCLSLAAIFISSAWKGCSMGVG